MTETVSLHSPATLGTLTLRNRIVFGAHTTNLADAGVPGTRMVEYYVERGRGGAAMIVVEPMPVSEETRYSKSNLIPIPLALDAYRTLTSRIRETGAHVIQQLLHLGAHVDSSIAEAVPVAPQGTPSWVASQAATASSAQRLERVRQAFVERAVESQQAGFEGIELFANYQGFLEQTWTAELASGPRDNESLARACALSASICRDIKARCGPDFIVGMAISAMPATAGVLALEDIVEIIAWHDRHGLIDYVSCGSGGYRDTSSIVPSPFQEERIMRTALLTRLRALGIRALLLAEAGMHDEASARQALADGADLVSLVRAQICAPDWSSNVAAGKPELNRPCTACNQACIGRRARDLWVSCLSNPRAGREHRLKPALPTDAGTPRSKALVLGGGVAGLESARTLAQRGWDVELYEAGPHLGGKLLWMAKLPGLERHQRLLAWYERELHRLGVVVRVNQQLTPTDALDSAIRTRARALILATGAQACLRPLQRAYPDGLRIVDRSTGGPIDQALQSPPASGSSLLLVDDFHNHRGLTVACWLQESGVRVSLVTSQPAPGMLLAGAGMQVPLRQRFACAGGHVYADTVVTAWEHGTARLKDLMTGSLFDVKSDFLTWSCPSTESASLAAPENSDVTVCVVGDAAGERDAEQAILEAHRTALDISPLGVTTA